LKVAAIIAHYDLKGGLNENFCEIVSVFCEKCSHVILVSTSGVNECDLNKFNNLTIINRPNIGYDFFSYRVGFNELLKLETFDKLFFVNSSFILLNKTNFINALAEMMTRSPDCAVGVTASEQISKHLQSYLLLIGKSVIYSEWFVNFINAIQPENTKFNVIAKYEIGLSTELIRNGVTLQPIFVPSTIEKLSSPILYAKYLVKKIGFFKFMLGPPNKYMQEVNWTHYGAKSIGMRFGFIKTEVARSNPFGVNLDFLKKLNNKFITESSVKYAYGPDGLAQIIHNDILISKISYGSPGGSGVKVAVVLHLYYIDLLMEIAQSLRENLIDPFDIFVTTPFEGDIPKIIDTFANIAASTNVFLNRNAGRDIAPFLEIYKTGMLDKYSGVLKIHSKKSLYSANGDCWRKDIYRQLIGGSYLTRKIIDLLEFGEVGMIGVAKYYLSDVKFWGADKANASKLLITMGVLRQIEEPKLGFFAGSMFWFNPKALLPLKNLQIEFEPESGAQDGTIAHAVERVFCQIVRHCGFIVTSPEIHSQDIDDVDFHNNRVPVL